MPLTWRYTDGSREAGDWRAFEEQRGIALGVAEARGTGLQSAISLASLTLEETPIPRAAQRELLRTD